MMGKRNKISESRSEKLFKDRKYLLGDMVYEGKMLKKVVAFLKDAFDKR